MALKVITILLLSMLPKITWGQLPKASDFFPLKAGNEWLYGYEFGGLSRRVIESDSLIGDTLTIYKVFDSNWFNSNEQQISYYYYNSDSSVVYRSSSITPNLERCPLIDTKKMVGEKWLLDCDSTRAYAITDTGRAFTYRTVKSLWATVDEVDALSDSIRFLNHVFRFEDGIGLTEDNLHYLYYAKINGEEFGTIPSVKEKDGPVIPQNIRLQIYPNPVRDRATFYLPTALNENIDVAVVNILGQTIMKTRIELHLANEFKFRWNGTDLNGYRPANGIYLVLLSAKNITRTATFIFLKK